MSVQVDRRQALGLLSAGTLAAPAAARWPQGTPDSVPPAPWSAQGTVAVGGGRLHYVATGERETGISPLVLLHKLGGWIADWRHMAPLLSARRPIIAFDLPGHGQSTMNGPAPYILTVPESAAMIVAALDELGIDRCSIVGNSLGGIMGAVIAAMWPHKVERLGLISCSLIPAMSRAQLAAQDLDRQTQSRSGTPGIPQVPVFATMDPAVTREHDESSARAGAWLRPAERGVGRVGVTDYLPRVQAPTLIVTADRGSYAKYGEVGLRLLPRAKLEVVRNAGSFVHQERPAETAALVNSFLNEAIAGG